MGREYISCAPSFFAKRQESPGLRRDGEISLSVRPFDPVIAALPNDREVAAAQ
jgi:hypothetical protein